jgi:Cytochrome P460
MKSLAAALSLTLALPALAVEPAVKFPEPFRSWKHVKSMVINQGHPLFGAVGGIHHLYANPKALQGYQSRKFPDGAVIAFDLFEAVDKDNAISEGPRKAVVVMERSAKRFAATDGWGYQVFDPKSRKGTLDTKGAAECAACHASQKDAGYVFSELRD